MPGAELLITGETGNDPRSYRVDFSRARKELGYEAQWTIPDGAAQLAREYRARGLTQEAFDKRFTRLAVLTPASRPASSTRACASSADQPMRTKSSPGSGCCWAWWVGPVAWRHRVDLCGVGVLLVGWSAAPVCGPT